MSICESWCSFERNVRANSRLVKKEGGQETREKWEMSSNCHTSARGLRPQAEGEADQVQARRAKQSKQAVDREDKNREASVQRGTCICSHAAIQSLSFILCCWATFCRCRTLNRLGLSALKRVLRCRALNQRSDSSTASSGQAPGTAATDRQPLDPPGHSPQPANAWPRPSIPGVARGETRA